MNVDPAWGNKSDIRKNFSFTSTQTLSYFCGVNKFPGQPLCLLVFCDCIFVIGMLFVVINSCSSCVFTLVCLLKSYFSANNFAMQQKRKTISAQDVYDAMSDMEFERYVDPLKKNLEGSVAVISFSCYEKKDRKKPVLSGQKSKDVYKYTGPCDQF